MSAFNPAVDALDARILALLAAEGRLPISELARRLESEGVYGLMRPGLICSAWATRCKPW